VGLDKLDIGSQTQRLMTFWDFLILANEICFISGGVRGTKELSQKELIVFPIY
jgi:hypothetical protein